MSDDREQLLLIAATRSFSATAELLDVCVNEKCRKHKSEGQNPALNQAQPWGWDSTKICCLPPPSPKSNKHRFNSYHFTTCIVTSAAHPLAPKKPLPAMKLWMAACVSALLYNNYTQAYT